MNTPVEREDKVNERPSNYSLVALVLFTRVYARDDRADENQWKLVSDVSFENGDGRSSVVSRLLGIQRYSPDSRTGK